MKRVNFLCLLMLGLFFTACHSSDDTWGDWSRSYSFSGRPRTGAVTFTLNGEAYVGLGHNESVEGLDKELKDFWKFNGSRWVAVESFPGEGRYGAVAFVVKEGGKEVAYVGTGFRSVGGQETYFADFYRFDGEHWDKNVAMTLPEVKDRPGENNGRRYAVAFTLNNKGYVGTGLASGDLVLNDMYCFDPTKSGDDRWSDAEFNGEPRMGAVAFVIGDKAVVCLGSKVASGQSSYVYDVKIFDGNTWADGKSVKNEDRVNWDNDYDKIARAYAVAFTSTRGDKGNRAYIATGIGSYRNTCWEYDIVEDRWYEVTEMPSLMTPRGFAVGFTLNDYGYVTTGGSSIASPVDTDCWKFTPNVEEDSDNDYSPAG